VRSAATHAATVVRPGRTFLKALFMLLHHVKQPHHYVWLTASAQADIMWWKCFLGRWSGCSFFISSPIAQDIYADASGSWGCGVFSDGLGWFHLKWSHQWQEVDISVKELVHVTIAAAIWGIQWAGKRICSQSDNAAVMCVLNQDSEKKTHTRAYVAMYFTLQCILWVRIYCHACARSIERCG